MSKNPGYESPWYVTGISWLEGPQQGPKGVYVQIELLEQGKVSDLYEMYAVHEDNLAKKNKQMNRC